MAVDLDVVIGTVSYTDYLHVTAAKVASPTVVEYETWIAMPVTSYTLVIPGLDPEIYFITFYESPDNVSLGTLRSQLKVNGLTSEYLYERRFYTCGGAADGDPANGDNKITDTYLIGKNVTGVFKEAFRYYEPVTEYDFDDTIGEIEDLTGVTFNTGEKVAVELKYASGVIAVSSNGGLYAGTLNVPDATKTLLSSDKNKLIRLTGSAATQVITLPTLAALSVDDGFYFDNSVGGTANQVKIIVQGGDRINYNGFMLSSNEFSEFWVSKGQHLLIKKFDSTYYEIRSEFKGVDVGERITPGLKSHPLVITENGQLMDGDEWPLMWWWINNVLPNTHYYITDTVTGSFTADATKLGQFAIHSTLKKFRMPSTYGLMSKGLANFESYGTDTTNRPVDYPGGIQAEQVGQFIQNLNTRVNFGSGLPYGLTDGSSGSNTNITFNSGKENRVKNTGDIYARRMG